jgi:hypothetical protein
VIRLTLDEMRQAALVAVMRRYESRRAGLIDLNLNIANPWDNEIEGAAAELAYAKHKGLPYAGTCNTFHLPDVGAVHVRSTRYATGSLIIRPRDPDGIYALVIGGDGTYRCVGRMTVVKNDLPPHYLKTPNGAGPAWFIPQSALEPDDI